MKAWLAKRLYYFLLAHVAGQRPPDFVIGADSAGGPYLLRWYITPWRGWYRHVDEADRTRWQRMACRLARLLPNLYLHKFLRDDDERALHDHPSWAASFILETGYIEHTIAAGGIHRRRHYRPGTLRLLSTRHAHRIELLRHDILFVGEDSLRTERLPQACWTLFLFGPTVREWGFHHPQRGWIHYKDWVAEFGG